MTSTSPSTLLTPAASITHSASFFDDSIMQVQADKSVFTTAHLRTPDTRSVSTLLNRVARAQLHSQQRLQQKGSRWSRSRLSPRR